MAKYRVTFYYNTYIDVEVEAENEEEALKKADRQKANTNNLDKLFDNLSELDETDVVPIEE